MTAAALPTSEEVARSYVAPLWNLRTLLPSIHIWRTRDTFPRCGWCIGPRCYRPSTAASPWCVGHQRRVGR